MLFLCTSVIDCLWYLGNTNIRSNNVSDGKRILRIRKTIALSFSFTLSFLEAHAKTLIKLQLAAFAK